MAETDTLEQDEEETPEEQGGAEEQEAVEKSRVHPLDPDFLIVLAIAFLFDALDIILEITGIFIIPKMIGVALDGFTFAFISWWMYIRVKRTAQTREQMKKGAAEKMRGFQRQAQQQALRPTGRGPLRRVLFRGLAVLIGELIPFVGLLPFWSITIFSTLREK